MKYSLLIGRYSFLHDGHKALIQRVLDEGKKPLVAIRDTPISEKDPFTYEQRKRMIKSVFGNKVKVIKIPDIEEVCYGREVGWGIRKIELDKDLEAISATKKRNEMEKQIFTGGYFSSGTRVVQFLLRQTHDVHTSKLDPIGDLDYEPGFSKRPTFAQQCLAGEKPEFPGELKEPWAVKNPGFMFCIPRLRELFPKSKHILVVRNGLDQILCNNRCMTERLAPHFGIGDLVEHFTGEDYFLNEMRLWNDAYKKALEAKPDLIVRLEDLVHDTKNTVQKIVELTGIPWPDTSMIKKPSSMERHKNNWTVALGQDATHLPEVIIEKHYKAGMIPKLYEAGKEMMDYFNYGI